MKTKRALRTAGILAALLSPAASPAALLFESDLDTGTGWFVVQEVTNPSSLATFGYDYSAVGIPPSPNGGGSTVGLRLAANATGTNVQAITAATTATFSGQYTVTFDFWGNTWGTAASPLPVGAAGSTEYVGGGVGFSGTAPRKGASALASTDGNAATDWRLDKDAAAQTLASGFYNPAITSLNITASTSGDSNFFFTGPFPAQSAPAIQGSVGTPYNGTIAFGWHTMTIDVDSDAGTAKFTIDSTVLGTLTQTGTAVNTAGSGSLTLLDSFLSISNSDLAADAVFGVFDNYKVEQVVPEPTVASLLAFAALPLLRRRRAAPGK